MVRENMKQQSRYFLRKKSRFAKKEYYHESGTQDVGTPDERDYYNMTQYLDEARSFRTIKEAKRIAVLMWERFGERFDVVDRYGEVY